MSEMAKTLSFLALAVVALVLGYAIGPGDDNFDIQAEVGKKLNDFTADDVKGLRIVTFEQKTATRSDFEIEEKNGQWTIASKDSYPANAFVQMTEAATCLIDRKILRVAAENATRHKQLGLIDPTSSGLSTESEGVGTRVTMTDNSGSTLTDMVIGKKVRDEAGQDEEEQYFVRSADSDFAYVIKLNPASLTTRFEKWIDRDLLELDPDQVSTIQIKDYSANLVRTSPKGVKPLLTLQSEITLRHDISKKRWFAEEIRVGDTDGTSLVEQQMSEDEELDSIALGKLIKRLSEMSIVDVERKPEVLVEDLREGRELLKNIQAIPSLYGRGFYARQTPTGQPELISRDGELVCTLATGVEYVLRFGGLKLDAEAGSTDSEEADPNVSTDDGLHRYLFVSARLNKSAIQNTELPELPELPEGVEVSEEDNEDKVASAESSENEIPVASETDSSTAVSTEETQTKAQQERVDDPNSALESEALVTNNSKLIAEYRAIEERRKTVVEENKRKEQEAQKTVDRLNERFGDWFYVIDHNVFTDIHLSRDDVVKKKD